MVRFRDTVPQQIGGWRRATTRTLPIGGVVRDLRAWRPLNFGAPLMSLGTNEGMALFDGAEFFDITPDPFPAGAASTIGGYGGDTYGLLEYGTPRPSDSAIFFADLWHTDNWGEMLVASFTSEGIIYEYLHGTDERLIPIANAPRASAIFVSDERHLFALGADNNPLRVRWSDQEDRNTWEPLPTNRAGGFTLRAAGRLLCGRPTRGRILLWTTEEVFEVFPSSRQFVYGYDRIGSACGAIGPKAVTVEGEFAFWMGRDAFWIYDRGVRRLECEVEDHVFGDLNRSQANKILAANNSSFQEVWFFYVSANSQEVDRAVSFDYSRGVWSTHEISRTAWIDRGFVSLPHATSPDGILWQHEVGDAADGQPIPAYIESSPVELGAGDRVQHISGMWIDAQQGGPLNLTLQSRMSARGNQMTTGPIILSPETERIMLSLSARQVSLRFETGAAANRWELGQMHLETRPGGLR
jgi:hypothetical protein